MTAINFQKWASGFSGCDGGDIGNINSRSTWVCGLEWGGGHDPDTLLQELETTVDSPPPGYDSYRNNLHYIFNRQTMKLLSAIEGGSVESYEQFACDSKPFVEGSS